MEIRKDFLSLAVPDISEQEIYEVIDCLKSGWISVGPKVKKFEKEFAEYHGVKHAIATSSCTTAFLVAARVMGNHVTITVAGSRGNFELNVMMPVLVQSLLESVTLLANVARAFTDKCVLGIEANEARCRELLELNPSIATALNPYIGYDKAAEVAKASAKEHLSVRDIVIREGLLPEDEVDGALDVRGMTEPGLPD